MTRVESAAGIPKEHVVTHSRALLAGVLDELLKHTQELGDAISDAVTADARVGACPKCGKDLVMKTRAPRPVAASLAAWAGPTAT